MSELPKWAIKERVGCAKARAGCASARAPCPCGALSANWSWAWARSGARTFADKVARRRVDVGCVVTVEVPADGAVRAITRAITPGQPTVITVTRGQSKEGDSVHRRDKTAGQRVSDLRWEWWPGAGSNRRPSDFQLATGQTREARTDHFRTIACTSKARGM